MTDAPATLSHVALNKYLAMPQNGRSQVLYVWIDANLEYRCKTKTVEKVPTKPSDLSIWNYDGSSTNQAVGKDSDVFIRPVALFNDPFRGGDNKIALCETLLPDLTPHPTNTRAAAKALFDNKPEEKPWFGIEQEYTLLNHAATHPFGWPEHGFPGPQGPYYCGVGTDKVYGRHFVEAHYRACLAAGVKIAGTNAEVMPAQWEYQIGPCEGIESGDHTSMARYLAYRVSEDFGVVVSFHPKPIKGDWNGAGAHCNYSTEAMRQPGGIKVIKEAIIKMESKHQEHIDVYGEDNNQRLTGLHETASIEDFSYGVANRGCSIRIPRQVDADGCGYLEDRRPASNCDPYLVSSRIFATTTDQ